MHRPKTRLFSRIASAILALALTVGTLPATIIPAFAASTNYQLANLEESRLEVIGTFPKNSYGVNAFKRPDGVYPFANWEKSVDNYAAVASWFQDAYELFVDMGVLLPLRYDTDEGKTAHIIPTLNVDSNVNHNGDIAGNDALGICLLYYAGAAKNMANSNKALYFRVYKGSSTRKDTFTNAYKYFSEEFGGEINLHDKLQGKPEITRAEAMYLIAYCAERVCNGKYKMSNYSEKKIGYMKNNTTRIKRYKDGKITLNSGGVNTLTDVTETQNICTPQQIRAINFLIDMGTMKGKATYGGSDCEIAPTDLISYAEFILLLFNLDDDYDSSEGGSMMTPYSEVKADLSLSAKDTEISYRDFLDGDSVSVQVTANASGSTSEQKFKSFEFEVEDDVGSDEQTSSGSSKSKTFTFKYDKSDLGFTSSFANKHAGEYSYDIEYSGSVKVTDIYDVSDGAKDDATGTIDIVNYRPSADFTATTDGLASTYAPLFFYATRPITITDYCSDYEDAVEHWYYTIKRNGATIAQIRDFETIYSVKDRYISKITADAKNNTINVTFSTAGDYVIEAYCVDEMDKQSATATRLLHVTGAPAAPTAIINGLSYTYRNTSVTLTDASTDPNDDIVKWVWDPTILYFDEITDENGDGTGEGEWIVAKSGTHYTGTLNNQTLNGYGYAPTATATFQFKVFGKFRIGLTVTDATNLSDKTVHEIEVLESIPVVDIDPDPDPGQEDIYYTVTFINTDDTKTTVKVKAGEYVKASDVPAILDVAGVYEHGWTQDGRKLVEPTEIKVTGNLTFVVLTTQEDTNSNVHTVTFINTDGSTTTVKVPHGGSVPSEDIPNIIDEEKFKELGWTSNGETVIDPSAVTIERDMIFWVLTEDINVEPYHITFVNTDGTVTKVTVPQGSKIPASKVPAIVDLPGIIEKGWLDDTGAAVADPSAITPTRDMVFVVDTEPENNSGDRDKMHLVTFINSDGAMKTLAIPDGEKIPADDIPAIKDY